MTSFGIVRLDLELETTFYRELKPLPNAGCNPDALAVAGMSMEHLADPIEAMTECADWLHDTSDNHWVWKLNRKSAPPDWLRNSFLKLDERDFHQISVNCRNRWFRRGLIVTIY